MKQFVTKFAAVVGLGVALAACDDPLGPEDFAGSYQLHSVAGDPLPALLFEGSAQSDYVLSDYLEIDADVAVFTRTIESRPVSGPVRRYTSTIEYRTSVEGDHLVLALNCPVCVAALSAPLLAYHDRDGRLRLEGLTARGPLLYEQIALY
jgi:hypothetical protein